MANELPPVIRKFFDTETDYKSPITEGLIQSMASALNALCEVTNLKCTLFTQSGIYETSPTRSNVLAIGVGGGGGGGSSGRRGAVFSNAALLGPGTFFLSLADADGREVPAEDGVSGAFGSPSMFNGQIVGGGGRGGAPGIGGERRLENFEFVSFPDPIRSFSNYVTLGSTLGPTFEGSHYGNAGDGGRENPGVFFNDHNNPGAFSETFQAFGYAGQHGCPGTLGFSHFGELPSGGYPVIIGAGGAGGVRESVDSRIDQRLGGPQDEFDFTFQANPGQDGQDGAVYILEWGF